MDGRQSAPSDGDEGTGLTSTTWLSLCIASIVAVVAVSWRQSCEGVEGIEDLRGGTSRPFASRQLSSLRVAFSPQQCCTLLS